MDVNCDHPHFLNQDLGYFYLIGKGNFSNNVENAFRRYVASILDDKHKASRKSIQKLLRHKKESTTERYLYRIYSDLKDMAGMGVPAEFFEERTHEKTHGKEKGVK